MRFKLLGSIDVVRDGARVSVGGPQQRRLLGMLLVGRGYTVSADRLVDVLWPDGDAPEGAGRSLPTYVSRLRGALGDGLIATTGSGYRLLCDDASFDVDEFEALIAEAVSALPDRAVDCYDRALALWEGPDPFGEFGNEWWALAESTRLAELRALAREERAGALMAIGHCGRAVPDLEGLIVEHPLRERPVVLVMQALVATGRQAEALRVFRAYRTRLAEETGLEPSGELVQLERTIAGGFEPPDGTSLGRPLRGYIIREPIGEGSRGRVYAATQPGTDRRVAIKVIRPDLADSSEFIRRFEAEARLVARLEHPHIVPLYDYWREPGGAYLVFRCLAGGTARASVISGGAWSLQRVSQLVEEVGGALIAAHSAGVLHNDVKASNVMLDDHGAAYLSDFGVAVGADDLTAGADPRRDVRALGWMLRELLTGAGPGPVVAARFSNGHAGPDPSLVGGDGVPESLDAVLAMATATDGGYATVAELVVGWRAAMGRPEGVLSPVTSDERRTVDSARSAAARQLARSTAAGVNPYKGLRSFDEADASTFFGRDAACAELEAVVGQHRLVTVVGASGSGKSSLVRAALVPRLRAAGVTVVAMVPGDDPVAALGVALSEVANRRRRTNDLAALIGHVVAARGPLVVVIDQLEECWTVSHPDRRDEFLAVVASLLGDGADVRFMATVRADVLDRPLEDAHVGAEIGAGAFVLAPMTPAQLGEAITLPAARAGVTVDEAVVAELVTEAATQPGSLPLLQFTLSELYDRRADGCIGADALTAVGGMAASIARRAEALYSSLDEQAQACARALFSRLVTPGDGVPDTRRRAGLSELSDGARAVAERYAAARLIVADRDQATREPTVEVAHEALITRWPRLAGWVDDDRRWLTQLHHLAAAARAWDGRERPPAELYRGARLEAAIEAIDVHGRAVSDVEREFVDAGRKARDSELHAIRRSARRLRRLLAGVAALLVVTVVAGSLAFVAQRQAGREQRAASHRALVSNSVAERVNNRELAALLAIEAHRIAPSASTESALFGTFTAALGLERTVHADGGPDLDAVLLDRATMAMSDPTGVVQVVDLATGAEKFSLSLGVDEIGGFNPLDATPDGRYVASYWRTDNGEDPGRSQFTVWDLETRRQRFSNVDVAFGMGSIALDADGALVAVGGGPEGRALVFDARTGKLMAEVDPIPDQGEGVSRHHTAALGWAPNGELIVGSIGGVIRFIDPTTGRELRRIEGPRQTNEMALLVSPDSQTLVTGGWMGHMMYDLESGDPLWPRPTTIEGCVEGLAYIERLGAILCGENGAQRVWAIDVETGAIDERRINGQSATVCAFLTTPGGALFVEVSCNAEYAMWRLDGGGATSRLVTPASATGQQWVFAYTADGRSLLTEHAEQNSAVTQLVDPASGMIEDLPGIFAPAPTDDPSQVVAAIPDDQVIGVYDLDTRARAGWGVDVGYEPWGGALNGERALVWGAAEDNGEQVAHLTGIDENGRVKFDLENREFIHTMAVFPDPGHLVTRDCAKSCVLQRRDPDTGAPIGEPVSQDAGFSIIVGGAGVLVAVVADSRVLALDPDTLDPVGGPFPSINGWAVAGALSEDGERLALLGGDGNLRLYNVPSRTQLGDAIPVGIERAAAGASIALRPDGLEVSVATDQGIVVWNLDPQHWIDGACAIAARNLTRAEWNQHIGELAPYRATCPQFQTAE